MPRLKEETRLERRSQIADAALRCFARNGFAGTSMADIIAESGLSAGSIYSHFESKADLLRYVAADTLELGGVLPREGFGSPVDAIRTLSSAVGMTPEFATILLQVWAEATRDPEFAELAGANIARVRAWIAAGLAQWATARGISADQATDVTLALLQGYVARLALDPTVDPTKWLGSASAVFAA